MMRSEPSPDHSSAQALARCEASKRSSDGASADESENANNNNDTTVDGGSATPIDPNLLSPPLSLASLETPPFKPAHADTTSLTMKSRRSRRARRQRDTSDRASTGGSEEYTSLARPRHGIRQCLTSSSVPDLRREKTGPSWPSESTAGQLLMHQALQELHIAHRRESNVRSFECRRRASLPQRRRRWTMPCKAASTRVLSEPSTPMITTTTIVSSKDQVQPAHPSTGAWVPSQPSIPGPSQLSSRGEATNAMETPAMITLRRATGKRDASSIRRRTSLRPDAIISFPPPQFNRTTSTYFSSLFGLSSPRPLRNEERESLLQTSVRQSSWSTGRDSAPSLQQASVTATKVQLTANTIAAPAFTQIEFLPLSQRAHATQQEEEAEEEMLVLSARRCSTTIVSGSSVHEIIWDENVAGSSVGGSDSAPVSRRISTKSKHSESPDHGTRKQSSALVEKLEAQLRSNEERKLWLRSQSSGGAGAGAGASHTANPSLSSSSPSHNHQGDGRFTLGKLAQSWHRASLAKEMNYTWPAASPLDLKPSLSDHDLTGETVGIYATLQDEPPPSPSKEEPVAAFFPPLEGSAGNTRPSGPLRERLTSSAEQNKHVVIQEPVRSEWRKHMAIQEPASRCAKKTVTGGVGRASTNRHHLPLTTPSSSMGTSLGSSAHLRRASTDLASHTHQQQKESSRSWSRSRLSLGLVLGQGAAGQEDANGDDDDDDEPRPLLPRGGEAFGDGPGREDGLFGRGQQGRLLGLGSVSAPLSETHLPLTAGADQPRTMSVQDFVTRIERMNLDLNATRL